MRAEWLILVRFPCPEDARRGRLHTKMLETGRVHPNAPGSRSTSGGPGKSTGHAIGASNSVRKGSDYAPTLSAFTPILDAGRDGMFMAVNFGMVPAYRPIGNRRVFSHCRDTTGGPAEMPCGFWVFPRG